MYDDNKNKPYCILNGGLTIFFRNLKIRFFKISWLGCEQY